MRKTTPLVERFWAKVDVRGPDECWLWLGAPDKDGYGNFGLHSKSLAKAHRVSYELAFGPIPDGMLVCHKCDMPPCVNPQHLFIGTQADNTTDRETKHRHPHNEKGEAHGRSRLKDDQVLEIRRLHAVGNITQAKLASLFGTSQSTVSEIVHRKIWKHLP